MLFKKWLGCHHLLFYDKFRDVGLSPKEWEGAPDLCVGIDVKRASLLLPDNDLLELNEVGNKTIFIDSSVEEAGTTSLSTPSRDQDHIQLALNALPVNKALD